MIIDEISKNKPLPPTGKSAKVIWEDVKLDLLDTGLAHHGLKSKYYDKILKDDTIRRFGTVEEFRASFLKDQILAQRDIEEQNALEEERLKVPKKSRKKRTIRKFSLARPPWPENYRALLGAQKGQDLRHVVRNATLKKALLFEQARVEEKWPGREERDEYFGKMAAELGVFPGGHYTETVRSIYHKVYLHLGNLFPEAGGVNQAIGFLADPIAEYGKKLRDLGDTVVDIDEVWEFVSKSVEGQVKSNLSKAEKLKQKGGGEAAQRFLKGLEDYHQNLKSFLNSLYDVWMDQYAFSLDDNDTKPRAEAWDLADDLIDIGDNFGFDLILTEDQFANVAQRQAMLIKVETTLQSQSWTPCTQELTAILKTFLSVAAHKSEPPKSPKPKESRSSRSGLVFPVGKIHRKMKSSNPRVTSSGSVYMAAVLEYLSAELVQVSGDVAKQSGSQTITSTHIKLALKSDKELNELLRESLQKQNL